MIAVGKHNSICIPYICRHYNILQRDFPQNFLKFKAPPESIPQIQAATYLSTGRFLKLTADEP